MADTAADVLLRLLELMALASRPGGVALEEASARLGREPQRLVDDLRLAANREDYHPPGWVDDLRIEIAPDRVEVRTSHKFDRPPGLTRLEALSLSLALRAAAAHRPEAARQEMLDLATRLDAGIASGSAAEFLPMISVEDGGDPDGFRQLLERAIRERRSCRIRYVGSSEPGLDFRGVDPYGLVHGNGTWYLIGRCGRSGETKVFRLDRVIATELLDARFDRPDDLDLRSFVEGGRVFAAYVHRHHPPSLRAILSADTASAGGRPSWSAADELVFYEKERGGQESGRVGRRRGLCSIGAAAASVAVAWRSGGGGGPGRAAATLGAMLQMRPVRRR